jgi:hypothetical protein
LLSDSVIIGPSSASCAASAGRSGARRPAARLHDAGRRVAHRPVQLRAVGRSRS